MAWRVIKRRLGRKEGAFVGVSPAEVVALYKSLLADSHGPIHGSDAGVANQE